MIELRKNIIKWADDKGILSKATPATQATKILEECLELVIADLNQNKEEIIDACGDIFVTLLIEARLLGLNLEEVLPIEVEEETLVGMGRSARSILSVATNIFGSLTEDYDELNNADRFIQLAYYRLLNYCKVSGIDFYEAVESAYGVIAKRSGKMINGVFVKDE